MAERIDVDPGKLRAASRTTDSVGTAVGNIVDKLRGALAIESDSGNFPWGNDSFGKKFSEGVNGYKEGRNKLLEGGTGMTTGLHAFADGQRQAADLMEGIDSGD